MNPKTKKEEENLLGGCERRSDGSCRLNTFIKLSIHNYIDMDDSGLRFSDFKYHDSWSMSDDEDMDLDMSREGDTEVKRAQTPNNVEEEMHDCLHFRGKKYEELQLVDLDGMEFQNINEVDKFYNYYALAMGFSVRKFKMDKNAAGIVVRRQLVCSKEGVRKVQTSAKNNTVKQNTNGKQDVIGENNPKKQKCSRRTTRENCPASFIVRRCHTRGVYYATEFITEHNHQLVISEHARFLRSHRNVRDHDLAQVTALRKASVKTSQAYEYLVHQAGGYKYVGFTLKDLYNSLDSERREITLDGDAQAAISFMNLKASHDPEFYCFFNADQEGRLANIFWRDSQSLIDYNSFGDVLILDSTYKTNLYGKPLAVFVGVNNHRATVLFGCALLVDETEDTYKWVISSFLASMKGKKPISVITDGDVAMWNAVTYLIPEARHRLCAWHIGRNVCQNVKDADIQKDFCHLIYAGLTVDEWDTAWHYMVAMSGLENNTWVTGMYNKRERWAEAFFREHFFGGICSTQRCEGMHRNLKGGLGRYRKLYEVLPRMDRTIDRMRDRVLEDDFKSINSSPVYDTHMRCLEELIGKKFTHDIFLMIRDQIRFESKFVIADRVNFENTGSKIYKLTQYGKPERRWSVTYLHDEKNPSFQCSCKLFESDGIPCCHIFTVMKDSMLTILPESMVTKRWTKDANVCKTIPSCEEYPDNALQLARYGEMMAECAQICYVSSFKDESYEDTINDLRRMTIKSRTYWEGKDQSKECPIDGLHKNVIRDPVICRTKGTQPKQHTTNEHVNIHNKEKGRRGCRKCGRPGHNQRTCKKNSQDQKTGEIGGGPKKHRESAGPKTEPVDTSHPNVETSSRVRREAPLDATDTWDGDEESDSSDWVDEEDVPIQNCSNSLIHHKEEARTFDFFVGYDNYHPTDSVIASHGNNVNSSTHHVHTSYSSPTDFPADHEHFRDQI